MTSQLPAIVTLLTLLLLFLTLAMVSRARSRYGIKAPAVTGDPAFERVMRVQVNTLEATVMFLPALWLASQYDDPLRAGIAGAVWLAARLAYAVIYARDAARRGPAFMIGLVAWASLMVMAGIGMVRAVIENA
jgi:glutathione S-transferase